ncbi:hypothetical protein [Azospirillum largimobile]
MAGSGRGLGKARGRRCATAGPMPVRLTDFPGSLPSGILPIFPVLIL